MLELMTWNEVLDELLAAGILERAAIFDLSGERLAGSGDVAMTKADAMGILKSMSGVRVTHNTIFGLYLLNAKYSCLPVDQDTLIGMQESELFVAHRNQRVLICGFSRFRKSGSCLRQVLTFATKLDQGLPGSQPTATVSLI